MILHPSHARFLPLKMAEDSVHARRAYGSEK